MEPIASPLVAPPLAPPAATNGARSQWFSEERRSDRATTESIGSSPLHRTQRRDPNQLDLDNIHYASSSPPVDDDDENDNHNHKADRRANMSGRVHVLVRCRPLIGNEAGHTATRIHTTARAIIVNDPVAGSEARQFSFDAVLPQDADQAAMFAEVEPLIDHVLDGFHGTVFAYGQTGSGKTHTMEGLSYMRDGAKGRGGGGSPLPDLTASAVDEHGIMPRAVQLLFDRARLRQGTNSSGSNDDTALSPTTGGEPDDASVQYNFECSYYQIYNEVITDLLNPLSGRRARRQKGAGGSPPFAQAVAPRGAASEGLRVRWQKDNTFRVQNLFRCECEGPSQMREALFAGVQHKVMSSHLLNDQSSRSHCVFTVYVECRRVRTGDLLSRSEFSLVDLAGSEKLSLLASNPTAKLMRESIDINTSLLALGKVITALAQHSQRRARLAGMQKGSGGGGGGRFSTQLARAAAAAAASHVPYRDSKLTMLLKHALGGNSLTLMVACVSPSDRYVEETVSTLLFAGRASNIENVPHVNEDPVTALVRQLREEIRQLKTELGHYRGLAERGKFMGGGGGSAVAVAAVATASSASSSPTTGLPAALQQQSDTLADSLMAACDMLQRVFATNSQLRDAYDVVRAAGEEADVREVQLNAENIALRERIQMLESIVLGNESGEGGPAAGVDAARSPARSRGNPGGASEAGNGNALNKDDGGGGGGNSIRNNSENGRHDGRDSAAHRAAERTALRKAASKGPKKLTIESLLANEASVVNPAPAGQAPPSEGRREEGTTAKTTPTTRSSARKSQKRQARKTERRQKKMARRLDEYEERYMQSRQAAGTDSYANYYGRAAKATATTKARGDGDDDDNGGVGVGPSPDAVRRQLTTQRPEMRQAVTAMVVGVQTLLKKLPADDTVVAEFIPRSLKNARNCGALAFCGDAAEVDSFEQRRLDREARRAAVMQRQQELMTMVRTVIADRDFHRTGEEEAATDAPAAGLGKVEDWEARMLGRGATTSDGSAAAAAAAAAAAVVSGPSPPPPSPSPPSSSEGRLPSSSTARQRGGLGASAPPKKFTPPAVLAGYQAPRWETVGAQGISNFSASQLPKTHPQQQAPPAQLSSPYDTATASRPSATRSRSSKKHRGSGKGSSSSRKLESNTVSSMDKLLQYLQTQ